VDGVPLGPGKCVVDESGRVVPAAKLTMKQLRAEAAARGMADVRDLKKAELAEAVKVRLCRCGAVRRTACGVTPWPAACGVTP
jgi:hypothetical protein